MTPARGGTRRGAKSPRSRKSARKKAGGDASSAGDRAAAPKGKGAAGSKSTAAQKRAAASRKTAPSKKGRASKKKKKAAAKASGGSASARSRKAAGRPQQVFFFGDGEADGNAALRETLGGKGANLAEMTRLGVPVPPGFTISTEVCARFNKHDRIPRDLKPDVEAALARVEQAMGCRFGDPAQPLLVSVRSGARVSMPGMMDTVLNLGLNDQTVEGLAASADDRFAFDSYRRFIQMYSDVVLGVSLERFEARLDDMKDAKGAALDTDLEAADLRALVREYLELVEEATGEPFPQDPRKQLWSAVAAVLRSWRNERARVYRQLNEIDDAWGTAVNVQAMVFGNMGDDCATGVAFTRDPATGERSFYGEYLKNAQGEDVVAGVRTPQAINDASRTNDTRELPTLEEEMPRPYKELVRIYKKLEKHYRDMQDIEFTIQSGKLWMLQTRGGKRTTTAAVRIAVEMAKERLISRKEAVMRIRPGSLDQLLHPTLDASAEKIVIARGLPASPGAAVGKVVFSSDVAEMRVKEGEKVILVRLETSPEDILGMHVAEGILTARGGMTSHAAVVARGMGKCCIAGCGALNIDYEALEMRVGEHRIRQGDRITIDGAAGEVMLGEVPTVIPELGGAFSELMGWADRIRTLAVRTNADTPGDARIAREFGAQGIGLCRTEHMFFEPGRILAVREMILATSTAERERALAKLLPMQREDFAGIFEAMDGLPVTIRLLDPPLHEFLPNGDEEILGLARDLEVEVGMVRAKVEAVREFNPMLGHRGCRLGISFPEIYRMQVRAITEAACRASAAGVTVLPEIMIPLVAHPGELQQLREQIEHTIHDVLQEQGDAARVLPSIGTMIEVPRAALTADLVAQHADFFSFGTNDLTQMAYALSRDDAGKFLPDYFEQGILEDDPFVSIDEQGVGRLVQIGVDLGRSVRPKLKIGVCGEHGGDPKSIDFFARLGLDYVSCSPFRVPVACLAAAQAAIRRQERADDAGSAR